MHEYKVLCHKVIIDLMSATVVYMILDTLQLANLAYHDMNMLMM